MAQQSLIRDLVDITGSTHTLKGGTTYLPIRTVNSAAGSTLTLPSAVGSGQGFRIIVGTTVTSNSLIIQVPNGSHTMAGLIMGVSDDSAAVKGWKTAAASDTITLNGGTTGGIAGDRIDLIDIATNVWQVTGWVAQSGTEATPFSAAVS